MKLPVIVERNAWTLPQERYNADWVRENGVGLVVPQLPRSTAPWPDCSNPPTTRASAPPPRPSITARFSKSRTSSRPFSAGMT